MNLAWQSEDVSALDDEVLDQVSALINEANRTRSRPFLRDRMWPGGLRGSHNDQHAIILFLEGEMVGCVLVKERDGALWLYLLAVAPQLQGQNLGASIVSKADEKARALGLRKLRLEAVDRGRLVDFYTGLGFEIEGRQTMPVGHWGATEPFELATLSKPTGRSSRL